MSSVRTLLSFLAGLCLATTALAQGGGIPADMAASGNQACMKCHTTYKDHTRSYYHSDCAECHTLSDPKHLILGDRNVSFPNSDSCLSCHKGKEHKQMNWAFSEHKKANVQCLDCHGIHSPKKPKQFNLALWKTDQKSAVCMDCHQDVAARMNMPSHHPVKEGALSCVSCHDPHNGRQTTLRGKNDQCFQCHQSLRGPKVFEHRPVTEDCGTCHNPHGSPNPRLLTLTEPVLCLQCHAVVRGNSSHGSSHQGSVLKSSTLMKCSNCHAAVHGSHSDRQLKR